MCWFLKDNLKEWMQEQLNEHMLDLDMREESNEYLMDELQVEMLQKLEGMREKIKHEVKMEMSLMFKTKLESKSKMQQD